MKKESRKLNLNRETLMPMQSAELAGVHGGVTPTTVTTSSGACIGAASAISAAGITAVSMYFQSRGC